jgi:hypothetical protein
MGVILRERLRAHIVRGMPRKKVQARTDGLKGWKVIAGYLGIPAGTAQRWARDDMPVRREGRFTVADRNDLSAWLGRESHNARSSTDIDEQG